MPVITFQPSGKTADVASGTELLDAARQAGVDIDTPCGSKGTCGKCIVRVVSGDVNSHSLGMLPPEAVADGYVLACKTRVLNSPLFIDVPEQIGRKGGKFTEAPDDTSLVRHELFPRDWQFDPLTIKWEVDVSPPRQEDGLSDMDRLTRSVQKDWGKKEVLFPLSVIRKVAETLRRENGKVTVTLIREPHQYHVINVEPGDRATRHYGIAIDIGTTTVAVQLVFLPLAKVLTTRTDYNDQITCGLDVISRINYAQRPERLRELRDRILQTINRLMLQAA